jgi:hypothetical protein
MAFHATRAADFSKDFLADMVASEAERKTVLSETGPVTLTAPDSPQALLQGARFPPTGRRSLLPIIAQPHPKGNLLLASVH